ncbi:MAG: heavy-metal-associated domain-containing protein [Candidatus Thorarchaeota archaeon]
MEELKIRLGGLRCGNCALKVQNILKSLNGVNNAVVINGEALVKFNPSITGFDTFQLAIQELGYTASL